MSFRRSILGLLEAIEAALRRERDQPAQALDLKDRVRDSYSIIYNWHHLNKLFNLPEFPHLYNGENYTSVRGCWEK